MMSRRYIKHLILLTSVLFLGFTPVDLNGPKQYRPLGVWCYPATGCVGERWELSSYGPGAWHRLDFSDRIPVTATLVALNGLLIITPDSESTCYIQVYFRTPGATAYISRIIWMALNGSRTNAYALVPVVNAQVDFWWDAVGWQTSGCSFGLNVGVDAWE